MPAANQLTPGSDYLVVNNLGPGFAAGRCLRPGRAAAQYRAGDKRRRGAQPAGAGRQSVRRASDAASRRRPRQRFHIVSGPVTYYCGLEPDGTTRLLTRQSGYPIAAAQPANPVPAGAARGQRSLLAGRVRRCQFQYQTLASQRSALVILTLELQPRNGNDAVVRLVHQVHVDNAP